MPSVDVRAVPSAGAVSNVHAIQQGQADLAITFADVAYIAYSGHLTPDSAPFDRLRAIAVLQLTPVKLVARAGAPIHGPADLRGRSVGVGPSGSGTALTANLILQAFGLGPTHVCRETVDFQEGAGRILDGTLDAMFDNAINRSEAVGRAIEGGARLIPIEGPAVDTVRREYPFFKLTAVPGGMYPGIDRSVHTIGVDGLLICRRDLDEGLVYELTKQLIASRQSAHASGPLARMDLQLAPATPIPLHDGAARYYRERELSR
jgi:TRAP transporter TAXI family solute receptor